MENSHNTKKEFVKQWIFKILSKQIILIVFIFSGYLLCGFPGDQELSTCGLGGYIQNISFFVLLISPVLFLILFLKDNVKYSGKFYPLIIFVIGSIIPLLILGRLISMKLVVLNEEKISQKFYENSKKEENYSIITLPATNITSTGARLNARVSILASNTPSHPVGFYLGKSEKNMRFFEINDCRDDNNKYDVEITTTGSCWMELNGFQGGEPLIPLSPKTTYYFSGAIILGHTEYNEIETKMSSEVLKFTTL